MGLRALADSAGIRLGSAIRHDNLMNDPTYLSLVNSEFNIVTFENEMKPEIVFPTADMQPDFTKADAMVTAVDAAGQQIWGHNACWGRDDAIPSHILSQESSLSSDDAKTLLETMVTTVVSHFPQVHHWDINEIIEPSMDKTNTNILRDCLWLRKIGPEYVRLVANKIVEINPSAKVFLNDYNCEWWSPKAEKLRNYVMTEINYYNTPIHGIGFQFHTHLSEQIPVRSVKTSMTNFKVTGLELVITELDVGSVYNRRNDQHPDYAPLTTEGWARREAQGNYADQLISVAIEFGGIETIIFWGFRDDISYVPHEEAHLISDSNTLKSFYWAVHELLVLQNTLPE